jgi:hypothetical protein
MRCLRGRGSSAGGGGCLTHQASQGSEVVPEISLEDEGSASGRAVHREAFEAPALTGRMTAFHGIAGTMVEALPLWGAHWQVADQAERAIGETLTDIEHPAVVVGRVGIGALWGWIVHVGQLDGRGSSLATGLGADPLVAAAAIVIAVGGEEIAVRADRATLVVIATDGPQAFVPIGGMSAEVDQTSCLERAIGGLKRLL